MTQQTRNVNPSHYARLAYFCGLHCRICGKTPVEYHHLISLQDGGTNDVRNMIALCPHCHKLVHGCRERKGWNQYKPKGRPPKRLPGWEKVLEDWAMGRIGTREAKVRLGISQKSHIQDLTWVKNYFKEQGIAPMKNTLDIKSAKHEAC